MERAVNLWTWLFGPWVVGLALALGDRQAALAATGLVLLGITGLVAGAGIAFNLLGAANALVAYLKVPGRSAFYRFMPPWLWRFAGACQAFMGTLALFTGLKHLG